MPEELSKKIIIDVIDTPRGPVPSAESIKRIIELWNDVVIAMNENLEKIVDTMSKINKTLSELTIAVKSIQGKLDAVQRNVMELKIDVETIKSKLNNGGIIHQQKKSNFKDVAPNFMGGLEKRGGIRDILLSNEHFDKGDSLPMIDMITRYVNEGIISKIDCFQINEGSISIRRLVKKVRERRIVILLGGEEEALKLSTIVCSIEKLQGFIIRLQNISHLDALYDFLNAINAGMIKDTILLAMNFDLLFSQEVKNDSPVKVAKVINLIEGLLDDNKVSSNRLILILQVNDPELVDPILLKKFRSNKNIIQKS